MSTAPLDAESIRRPKDAGRRTAPAIRAARIGVALGVAALAAIVVAVSLGSSGIPLSGVVSLVLRPDGSVASEVIHQLRMPRALAAFATGGLLAYSGALMQVLFRNPLADPYVLGLSSGSAVGALGAMLLGLGGAFVGAGAFGGALATVAAVFALARRDMACPGGARAVDAAPRLLLTGVMLASAWSAIVTLILLLSPEGELRGMLFWLMGDLGGVDAYTAALVALPVLVLWMLSSARDLNAMSRGPEVAHSLGVRVVPLRRKVLVAASLAAAIAVTTAGTIGFVGLVVPHALRLAIGNDQRLLLPACALAGGTLLVVADTIARTAFAPQQLPVGVIMAFIGTPTFMFLLLRKRRA